MEVTKHNFEDEFPLLVQRIKNAAFVAIDTEFTALTIDEKTEKSSLFDTGEARYKKHYKSSMHGIANQVGLSIFHFDKTSFAYNVFPYTFYVCPRSLATIDDRFVCQASCLQFLTRNNFDFNKFIRDGIPYLNERQNHRLKKDLMEGILLRATERKIQNEDEDALKRVNSRISQWMKPDPEGNGDKERKVGDKCTFELEGTGDLIAKFVLHQQIRNHFTNVWTFDEDMKENRIVVQIVEQIERRKLMLEDTLVDELVYSFEGFSRVVKALIESKKPIVGHNCFLDMIKIYNQFYKELPASYKKFKSDIHEAFPSIHDTKFLSYELRRRLEDVESELSLPLVSTNLNSLFKNLSKENMFKFDLKYIPTIQLAPGFQKYQESQCCHEAGYDAYMTGYVFLKCAHISATINYLTYSNMKPLSYVEHLNCLKGWRNKLNVGRASIVHINLEGDDPSSQRPCCLYVMSKSKNPTKCQSVAYSTLIAEKFARYGSVDVRTLSKNEALVAVSNHRTARDILVAFENDDDLKVTNYKALKHNKLLRWTVVSAITMFGFGAIGLGVTCLSHIRK